MSRGRAPGAGQPPLESASVGYPLWHQLLGRPVSESGRLCRSDGSRGRGDRAAGGGSSCTLARQRAICYRVSTGELPPTSHSQSQGRWCPPRVFSVPRCSALEGVQADYRLITQRLSVQIRPPQPKSPQKISRSWGLGFSDDRSRALQLCGNCAGGRDYGAVREATRPRVSGSLRFPLPARPSEPPHISRTASRKPAPRWSLPRRVGFVTLSASHVCEMPPEVLGQLLRQGSLTDTVAS